MFVIVKLLYKISFYILPKYYTLWAKIKFRIYAIQYGSGLMIDGSIALAPTKGKIVIGKDFRLNSRFKSNLVGLTSPAVLQVIPNGFIKIGDNCGFSSPIISSRKRVEIGNNVFLGGNVRIYDHDYHPVDFKKRNEGFGTVENIKAAEIVIGDDVFVGANAIILKGVSIGARSVIGAGSVVSIKNIPPDSLVAGNPAKIIKTI